MTTKEANAAVQEVLKESIGNQERSNKVYQHFTPEQHAKTGKYVAENYNVSAVRSSEVGLKHLERVR